MRLLRWVTVFGTGTAMLGAGVVLGACGGYSNLGDLPGHGGADDGTGGMSTGAKGGTGGKGETGGMGATGNVGMGTTGGTGMGATGNVGMGATGNVGTGGTSTGTVIPSDANCKCFAVGSEEFACAIPLDAIGALSPDEICMRSGGGVVAVKCEDGGRRYTWSENGSVSIVLEVSPQGEPVYYNESGAILACGIDPIYTHGTVFAGAPLAACFDEDRVDVCGGQGTACVVANDCPQPPPVCTMCEDGASPCARATCEAGVCGIAMPACDGSCSASSDCVTTDECLPCGDGCARAACVDGACQMMCPIGGMCLIDTDCRSELPDNVCTTGPWRCTDYTCSRQQQDCMAP